MKKDSNKLVLKAIGVAFVLLVIFGCWKAAVGMNSDDNNATTSKEWINNTAMQAPRTPVADNNAGVSDRIFSLDGELAVRGAIRYQAKNPSGVEFNEKTYESLSRADNTYECKYLISDGGSGRAAGYAKVKYRGTGSTNNPDNWEVVTAYIEDMR